MSNNGTPADTNLNTKPIAFVSLIHSSSIQGAFGLVRRFRFDQTAPHNGTATE